MDVREGDAEGTPAADHEALGFPCESCGARLEYKPGSEALHCQHCGHTQAIAARRGGLYEHDFATAMARVRKLSPEALVPGGTPVRCSGCGARTVIPGQASRCPFCRSPVVAEVEALGELFAPESVLPFTIDARRAKQLFAEWIVGQWFAPNDLHRLARQDEPDGVYVPYWTYDAETTTDYTGMHGTHYMVTVHKNGGPREEQRTRWRPAEGRVEVMHDDVLVCASKTLTRDEVRQLDWWDLKELQPYEPAYLSGFAAERYSVGLAEGLEAAKEMMDSPIHAAIRRDIGGDDQQVLTKQVRVHGVRFKHLLLPVWISSFRYKDRVFRFVINARTGHIVADRPWSAIKIAFLVLVLLLIGVAGLMLVGAAYSAL